MPKKVVNKTTETTQSVSAYLNSLEPASVRKDAKRLNKLFTAAMGTKPKMWGGSIIGYGQYTYYRANGAEGTMLASGFAMRKSGPVLYVISGYKNFQDLIKKIGPHRLGKSCLYLKNLEGIDLDAVSELISGGLEDLKQKYKVVI